VANAIRHHEHANLAGSGRGHGNVFNFQRRAKFMDYRGGHSLRHLFQFLSKVKPLDFG
jgi:hypothetical protein